MSTRTCSALSESRFSAVCTEQYEVQAVSDSVAAPGLAVAPGLAAVRGAPAGLLSLAARAFDRSVSCSRSLSRIRAL